MFQNCSVFLAAKKYIKYFSGTTQINSWKSNGKSEKNTEIIAKLDSYFAPGFVDYHAIPAIKFNGHCLINNNISIPKKVISIYFLRTDSMANRFK